MDNGLQVVALDVLEIAVCAHFQFVRCCLIAYDDAVAVHLQGTDGPHLRYASFNGMLQGTRLIVPVAKDQYLFGVHYRAHPYGQRSLGNLVHIVIEETRICHNRIGGQRLHTGTRSQGRTRLVERDVAVRTDAAHKQVDAPIRSNLLFIIPALSLQVGSVPVLNEW